MAMNYSDKVMEHFTNPQNVGEIENASGCGTVGNAVCGDIMRVYLDIDDNGVIQDAKFKTFGCGAAIATSSMATVLVKGKTVQEALEVTNKAVMDALDGLPPVKVHCSLLAEEAIHAALWDYAEKHGIVIEGAGEAGDRYRRARPSSRRGARGRRGRSVDLGVFQRCQRAALRLPFFVPFPEAAERLPRRRRRWCWSGRRPCTSAIGSTRRSRSPGAQRFSRWLPRLR